MFNDELNARLITDCCGANFKSNVFAGNERIMNESSEDNYARPFTS